MTKERMIELLGIEHECMRRGAHDECDRDCAKCELVQDDHDLDEMYTGVIALLKEQEARTGHWVSVNDGDVVAIDNDGFPERACFCSECKKYLVASDEYAVYGRYCPFCGAKMESR